MSYTTVYKCTQDQAFRNRIAACMNQQAWNNAELRSTPLGESLRVSSGSGVDSMVWPVAIEYEAPYEYAVNSDNPDPGGDPTVITDANILASVQSNWPGKAQENVVVEPGPVP